MEKGRILEDLFDSKILSILKLFLANEDSEFYLREISRKADVSAASTYRILNKLSQLDVLDVKEIKTAKLYCLRKNDTTEFLRSMIDVDFLKMFCDNIRDMEGIEEILQLGTRSKSKANILVLGDPADKNKVKEIRDQIKDKHSFNINYMLLSKEQYEQMSSMGLYPGNKKKLV